MGASAIAIAPVAIPPDVKISAVPPSSAAVDLVVNPIDFYGALFEESAANISAIVDIFLANPTPILSQVIDNQIDNAEAISAALEEMVTGLRPILTEQVPLLLRTAFEALADGDVETALNTLLSIPTTVAALPAFIGLGAVLLPIAKASGNINNVVQQVLGGAILGGAVAAFGPLLSTVGATGTAIQGVLDGVAAGDLGEVADAVINAPGVIIDGLLNGGYGPPLLIVPAPGLLSPNGLLGALGAGPIGFVLAIRQQIADAIKPPPVALRSAVSTFSDDAPTITVSTDDSGDALDATTPTPQGETPAITGAVDEENGGAAAGEVETVSTVVTLEEEDGDAGLPLEDDGVAKTKGTTLRPGQRLLKDIEQAGQRIERQFKEAGKRLDQTIDRFTGRGGEDRKGGNTTKDDTTNDNTTKDNAAKDGGAKDGASDDGDS